MTIINDNIVREETTRRAATNQVPGFTRSIQKNPNPVLAHGELHYKSTPAELAKSIKLFRT